ncbi:MAG: tetratricopeptide repeat protein [Syntrophobacter sp.]
MVFVYSILVFVFGILMWVPALRNNENYVNDVAGAMYWASRSKKGDSPFFKEHFGVAIGHIFHIFLMQSFWDKENTKAYYWIMAVYNALSAVLLFIFMHFFVGAVPAIAASTAFSIYIASPRIEGNWGLFEQLLPLPLFASILCLAAPSSPSHLAVFLAGMFFGYAMLMKQLALLYWPGYALILFGVGHSWVGQAIFIAGAILTNAVPLVYYWLKHNAFFAYLAGTWLCLLPSAINPGKYNEYYPRLFVEPPMDRSRRKQVILKNSRSLPPLLFLSCISFLSLTLSLKINLVHAGLLFCLLSSIAMVFMRGTFYPHYWLNTIPWLAIFSGIGLGEILLDTFHSSTLQASHIAALFATLLLLLDAIHADRKFYVFSKGKYEFLEKVFGPGLVDEYRTWESIGQYIKETTPPTSKILVCGWTPHILMYSDRVHFTATPCLYAEDYLNLFQGEYAGVFNFLTSIYKFRQFQLLPRQKNPFHEGYPEIIVFGTGQPDIAGFERLTGMKYIKDEKLAGYPLYRVDTELSKLMALFERPYRGALPDRSRVELMEKNLSELIELQHWDRAYKEVAELIGIRPFESNYVKILGEVLIKLEKFALLFEVSSRVLANKSIPEPLKEELMNKMGEACCLLDYLDQAENVFKGVLDLNGMNTTAMNNLGFVYFSRQKVDEAVACFQQVLRIDPENEDALFNLGQIEARAS